MADSLTIGGVEVVYSSQTSTAHVALAADYDFGAPAPTVAEVMSRFLDGAAVTGRASGNREISLTLAVFGGTRAQRRTLVAQLAQVVDSSCFEVTFTPDDGYAMTFDCFRGVTSGRTVSVGQREGYAVTVTFPALPFGRSPKPEVVVGTGSEVQIDALETAATGGTQNTTDKYEGAASNNLSLSFGGYSVATGQLSRTVASKNLSAASALRVRVRFSHTLGSVIGVKFKVRLDSAAESSWFTPEEPISAFQQNDGTWYAVTLPLSNETAVVGSAVVNRAAVTGWAFEAQVDAGYNNSTTVAMQVDDLRALPTGSSSSATARGAVYNLPGVKGTARTPCAVQLSRGGGMNAALVHRPPADAPMDAKILVGLDSTNTTSKDYAIAAPAPYAGTYAVVLAVNAWGASTGTHTVDVLFDQGVGATTVETDHRVRRQFLKADIPGRLLHVGYVTLPLVQAADQGSAISYTVTVANDALDSFTDLMLLDTRGQTVIATPTGAFAYLFVDEPTPGVPLGPVLASPTDRTGAFSVLRQSFVDGPMMLEPGSNRLLCLSPEGSPDVQVTYSPRWLTERTA